jgi:hypothetical protein
MEMPFRIVWEHVLYGHYLMLADIVYWFSGINGADGCFILALNFATNMSESTKQIYSLEKCMITLTASLNRLYTN